MLLSARPKIRLHSPMISFIISGTLKPADTPTSDDPYLTSGSATLPNLLESLVVSPKYPGLDPRIPALRLSLGSSHFHEAASKNIMLKINPVAIFRVIPALSARIKYHAWGHHTNKPALIASLEIETATYMSTEVTITAVQMQLSDGVAKDLSTQGTLILPLRCQPKDNPVFLFGLFPNERVLDGFSTSRILNIAIEANVMISESCRPSIQMHWTTMVGFPAALNASQGAPGQSIQRRPQSPSLPVTANQENAHNSAQTSQPIMDNLDSIRQEVASTADPSITIDFTVPHEIWVGEPFSLCLSILNRSSKPRNLAITVIPKRRRGNIKSHLSKASSSSLGVCKDNGITEVIAEENLLYAMQHSAAMGSPELVLLTTDLKIV